ncbi:MAG TPA: hypothetical protein VNT55_18645 [Baekduia sp.]|nr:hypothetical protein [Baekduia sp.]
MSRRRLIVVGLLVVALAGGVYLLARGGDGSQQRAAVADPLAEALSYAPAASPVVAQFDVQPGSQQGNALRELSWTFPAARFAADGVRSAVQTLGFDADEDLPSLLGGPIVVSGPASAARGLSASISSLQLDLAAIVRAGATAVVVGRSDDDVEAVLARATRDGRLRKLTDLASGTTQYALPDDAARLGVRDGTLVLGAETATLKRAFALHDAQGGLTRTTFDARLGPLARVPALIRATAQPRALVSSRAHGVPWVDALRSGALAVAIQKPGVRLRIHLATDPSKVQASDLPLAPGAAQPRPAPGARPIDAAVRGLDQTIRVLDATKGGLDLPFLDPVFRALSTLDSVKVPLKTFGRIDVDAALIDQLTGTTTITPEGGNTVAVRAELQDGDPLRTALNRIAAVPDFVVKLAGVELNVAHHGDTYTITKDGKATMNVAVVDKTLVVTNDLKADLRAIASRKPAARPKATNNPGALSLHVGGRALQDELVTRLHLPDLARLVLGGFGDIDGSARAERSGVDLDATLTLEE